MSAFVNSLKDMGVDTIRGSIYADRSLKDADLLGEGWCWDDDNPVLSPLVFQRKDRGDPPHFLRDLIRHSLSPAGGSGHSDPSTVMPVLAPESATRPDRARRN